MNDLRPQVRALISGRFILVPETFSSAELRLLETAAESDPALAEACSNAEQAQIIQYLAGGPAQVERYLTAAPPRKPFCALRRTRRLGWGLALPAGFLKDAQFGPVTGREILNCLGNEDHLWVVRGSEIRPRIGYARKTSVGLGCTARSRVHAA